MFRDNEREDGVALTNIFSASLRFDVKSAEVRRLFNHGGVPEIVAETTLVASQTSVVARSTP